MSEPERVTFAELARRYCERQDCEPEDLRRRLAEQAGQRIVSGWVLLECQVLDGTRCGELTIVCYGPHCTWKEPPTHPVSPRGLASDMSTVVAILENGPDALGGEK